MTVILASASTLHELVIRSEGGGDGSPKSWTALQPMFYGWRLLSATRAPQRQSK